MSVTIKEIAALANVSRGTVDKVLNNRPGVKEETKQRVIKIAEELHYQPNIIGKALKQSKDPLKIGIIPTPEYNPYIQNLLQGVQSAKEEFSSFGLELIIRMPMTLEATELLSILIELETMDIDGLALIPINDPQVIEKLHQMQAKGIQLLTFNSEIKDVKGFRYIGQDHFKAGRVAAGLMEKLLPGGGRIGVIISSKTLSCHPDRLNGFRQRLSEKENGLSIVAIEENQDKKEDTFRITLSYLNKYPDLCGLYLSGNGNIGVQSALEIASCDHPVKVICHDLSAETEKLLKDDVVDFVISQNAREQGYQIVKQFFDYLFKKIEPDSYIYPIPIQIISRELL